eukprot:732256-Pyramimonas_sp.AAC.1
MLKSFEDMLHAWGTVGYCWGSLGAIRGLPCSLGPLRGLLVVSKGLLGVPSELSWTTGAIIAPLWAVLGPSQGLHPTGTRC